MEAGGSIAGPNHNVELGSTYTVCVISDIGSQSDCVERAIKCIPFDDISESTRDAQQHFAWHSSLAVFPSEKTAVISAGPFTLQEHFMPELLPSRARGRRVLQSRTFTSATPAKLLAQKRKEDQKEKTEEAKGQSKVVAVVL